MKETTLTDSNSKGAAKFIAEIDAMFAEMARMDERIEKSQERSKIIRAETREILDRLKAR